MLHSEPILLIFAFLILLICQPKKKVNVFKNIHRLEQNTKNFMRLIHQHEQKLKQLKKCLSSNFKRFTYSVLKNYKIIYKLIKILCNIRFISLPFFLIILNIFMLETKFWSSASEKILNLLIIANHVNLIAEESRLDKSEK